MIIIKFLFYKMYSFYNRFWPNKDPELYAYFATVFVISLNIYTLHFLYLLTTNPSQSINIYLAVVVIAFCLVLVYLGVMKKGRYKELSDKDFKGAVFKGAIGNVFTVCYITLTFVVVLILAHQIRQYHL